MKIRIKDKTHTYTIEPAEGNPRHGDGDISSIFMYSVVDENDKGGCITFTWSGTARVSAKDFSFRSNPEEELAYLALIPYLPFLPEKIKDMYENHQYRCFKYMFNTHFEGLSDEDQEYGIQIENGMKRTILRHMFGGQPTDDQIRRHILVMLHNHWLDDPHTHISLALLNVFIPVEETALLRNAMFLRDDQLLTAIGTDQAPILSAKITNAGIKHIEDQSEFSIKVPSEFVYQKIMGNQIQASTTGANSPIIIDSNNINVAFNEVKTDIEKKTFDHKQEVLALLGQLEKELVGEKKPEAVSGILAKIKEKADWVNEKIISHPFLSALFVQLLSKQLGLT